VTCVSFSLYPQERQLQAVVSNVEVGGAGPRSEVPCAIDEPEDFPVSGVNHGWGYVVVALQLAVPPQGVVASGIKQALALGAYRESRSIITLPTAVGERC
jgi:hypothetical protein